ncbi:MAG: hypothetical protein WAN46_22395 [Gammaproteobacteria bacterium]|jgi:hypothetical protein
MSPFYPNVDIKSGGNAEAAANGFQFNENFAKLVNRGADLGVALPDVQSDEDVTLQGQNVQAAAVGGDGGNDNVIQTISV